MARTRCQANPTIGLISCPRCGFPRSHGSMEKATPLTSLSPKRDDMSNSVTIGTLWKEMGYCVPCANTGDVSKDAEGGRFCTVCGATVTLIHLYIPFSELMRAKKREKKTPPKNVERS
jgi:hypothetical protein